MKAVVYTRYGSPDVLEVQDVPKPVPAADELLVRVRATTVSTGDWRARSLQLPAGFGALGRLMFGITRPRQPILGTELAGTVEAIGKDVYAFRVGDDVFAYTGARMGSHAEYVCVKAGGAVAKKPADMSFEEAAALSFGGTTVLSFFRRAKLKRGERVLVNGASGAVGSAAVQLAKHAGAVVTGVCSGANVELVRSLGADHVIDYTTQDFTKSGEAWDVIVDTVGTAPWARSKRALAKGGRLLLVLAPLGEMVKAPLALLDGKRVVAGPAIVHADDVRALASLAEAGALRPVIDETFPVERIADAHRRVDSGHKRGNVVVTFAPA